MPCQWVLRTALDPEDVSDHMRDVASLASCVILALMHMHREGVLHRDINIQNVYDFGNRVYKLVLSPRCIALPLGSNECSSDGIAVRWSSPESNTTGCYTAKDDIWGFGILLWEALTGASKAPLPHVQTTDDAVRALIEGAKPSRPSNCDPAFWDHIVAPCFASADYRPSPQHLLEVITDYIEQEADSFDV
jgi:serine/threonine protein kinase